MRLNAVKTSKGTILYIIKDININGKRSTKTVERLGSEDELRIKLNGEDPYVWAKSYIDKLNYNHKNKNAPIIVKYQPNVLLDSNHIRLFNGGHLFLQSIYYDLKLDKICNDISNNYKFDYNLNSILSSLVYSRILAPSSKLSSFEYSKSLIDKPKLDIQNVYRALDVLSDNSDYIQEKLYKNSLSVIERNTDILYYDCTNYFFEIEEADGLKQYGVSKENRPNPIVQMGLFMDSNGIPLAFNINKGNTNEQTTLKPLEKKIIKDFDISKFVVCTDAGLSSYTNRKFNNIGNRAFITTQSIKKMKKHIKEWALSSDGWYLSDNGKSYNLNDIEKEIDACDDIDRVKQLNNLVFYKSRWINENGLEQRLIVTFSFKFRDYQRNIRNKQIDRAIKKIDREPTRIGKVNSNDYRRFIETTTTTIDGEATKQVKHTINIDKIRDEEMYDGFYGVCTNLESSEKEIVKINKSRWQIEECFRIMKSEFKARPVYLQRDNRIEAHFLTCFISLLIYRILENRLDKKYTCNEIIETLSNMKFLEVTGEGYIPAYTRTDITDKLHEVFGFRTDYTIISGKEIKKIYKKTKR